MRKIIFLLLLSSSCYSQIDSLSIKRSGMLEATFDRNFEQPKLKEYIPSGAAIFAAGVFDGVRDWSLFHAHGKGEYWDGAISHLNKYEDRDISKGPAYFGSTSLLAWTTDAPHLFNMLNHQASGIGLALLPYDPNKKIGHVLLKTLGYNIVRQLGQSLMYSVILK